MRFAKLSQMERGWFIGDFSPTALRSTRAEVAVKRYWAGDREELHHHRLATEVTLVYEGTARMNQTQLSDGDIVVVEPYEAVDFEAITDVTTVVFKTPSAAEDKYVGSANRA